MGNSQISVKLEDILNQTQDNDILQMTNAFVQQDISTDQFFEYIENIDIRSLIKQKPNEFQIFLGIIIYNLVEYSLQNEIKSNQVQYLINNLRIFIAIAPILHEIEFLNFTDNFYWNKLVITKRQEFQETVNGIALLFALQKLFMMPNFTVNYTNVPWETLTGENLNRNRKFDENRLTLLQCILALFGATLYRHNHGELFINPFIKYFTSPQNIKLNLVYDSLLATVLQHRENGFLPFSSMTQNKIQRHDLALLSSQLVSIMMYETGNWELANNQLDDSLSIQAIYRNYIGQFQITSGQQQLTVSSVMQGIYSNQVSQILQEDVGGVAINSVQKFVKSILNLLENPVKFSQQLIYGSFGQIGFVEELLAIFYRYATRNQKVYEEILESKKDLVKMFKVIMFCFCSSLEHQSMNNPFFICLAIFIHFSESDNFKQMLKMDLDFSYPSLRYFPVVGGSYGDFLVSCISQNIINGHFNNKNHYAYNQMALMTNISNILQNLSELTSNKLMQLMQVFTDFDFLLQNVYHPLCLIKLMSFIDNVLALQANQNPYLIFELCKSSNIINRAYKINFQENTLRGFLGDPQALEKMQAKIHNRSIRKSSSIQNQPSQQLQQSQQQENRQRQLPFTNKEPKKIILPNEEQMQDDKFFNSFAHKMPKEEQENLIQFWKNFDWQNYRKNMPRNNLEAVLLKVQEYLKQSNKKTLSLEHIYEMCNKKVFKDVVQVSEANYNTESFDLNGEIELILRSYTWSNVFAKSTQRPFFDPEKCVFYQRISQQHYADIFHQNLEDFEGEEGGEEGEQEEFQNNEQDVSLENHPSNDDVNRLNKRKNIGSKENELQIQDKQEVQFQKKKSNEQVQAEKGQKVENYEDEEEEEEESKVSKSGEVKKPPQKKASNNNNLYIISEADSKKEETMMAQGIHKRFSTYLDQDELKLREKTMNSSRKLDISNIKTAEKKDMGSFLNFTNQMVQENNEKIKQDKSKNEDEQVNQKQEETLQVPVIGSYSKVEEKDNMGEIEGQKLEEVQVQNQKENQNENQNENLNENDNQNEIQKENENYDIQIQKQIELEQLDYERKKEELEKLEQNQQNEETVNALQEGEQNQNNGYKQQKFKSRARKEKQQNNEQQQQVQNQEEKQELQENQEDFGDEEQVEIRPVQLEELSGKKAEENSEDEICDDNEQQQQLEKQLIEQENLQHEEKDLQQQEQQVDQDEQLEQQNSQDIETLNYDQNNSNKENVNLEKEQNQEQIQQQQENQNQIEQEKENENENEKKEQEQEQQDNDKNNEQQEQQSGKKKKNKKKKNRK